ncbi:type VII secretion protein EccE [Nocardia sp. BMG51109]|uniref:type VII secretion protein EccE n=1 Tax=Nocardia sp. BMG51109 TaxID=1056816 RepID=UPI0004B22CEA|nr:type VII secretion protein EccE [Nocardia sp. BMG51109]
MYDRLRDPEFWLFRVYPLRVVVPVLLVAAVAAWIVLATTGMILVACAVAAAVALLGLIPVRGRTLTARIGAALARRQPMRPQRQIEAAPAVDVPQAEGGSYGIRWDGDLLLTMLRIDPPPDTLTLLRRGSLSTDHLLGLSRIAACLEQFDIALDSIDVVSVGARTAGTGVAAHLYEQILGPLPAVAHRTVWLVLRLDPLANAEAVEKRGGGGEGAVRAAVIATRRIANRLAADDVAVSVLTAAEMNSAVRQLTHGFDVDALTETPRSLRTEHRHLTHYRIDTALLNPRGLAEIWSTPSLTTAVTLRLCRGADRTSTRRDHSGTVVLSAVVRFDTIAEPESPPLPGLRELHGQQLRMMLDTLPIAAAGRWDRGTGYRGTLAAIEEIVVPTAGCGQLIGADEQGQGIAVSLIGDGTRHLEVIGNLDVAQQVILRATALGAHVVVHTARPDAWHTMVTHLAAPHLVSIAPRSAGASYHPPGPPPPAAAPYPSTTVLVYDGIPPAMHAGGATIVHVRNPSDPNGQIEADVTLVQDPHAPNRITVRTAAGSATVMMVTTPDEMQYIGESVVATR